MIREELEKQFPEILSKVAKELGAENKLTVPYYGLITLPDGVSFYFGTDYHWEKATASGNWPRDSKGQMYCPQENRPSISFSLTKDPAKIATDIKKRFLPQYRVALAEMQKQVANSNVYYVETENNALVIANLLGAKVRDNQNVHFYGENSVSVDFRVSGKSVEIKLRNVSMDKVKQIIALFKR